MAEIISGYSRFFTATNLEWKMLLQPSKYKDFIIDVMDLLIP